MFVSTDALVPGGFTLNEITRNLPGRFVGGVAFDPNDPATIYAVLGGFSGTPGGHVFRTSLTAATWTDISPLARELDLPFNAIALDGNETPTALYTGTDFGVLRSVDGGANWSVLDDIHFPGAPVFELVYHQGELRAATFGRGVFSFVRPTGPSIAVNLENNLEFGTVCQGPQFLTLEIFNVGVSDLVITSVQRLMGSTGFSVLATPGTPLVIAAGEHVDFTVSYVPTGVVAETATIRILSNDPTAPAVDLSVTGVPGTARLTTAIADSGNFGNACLRSFVDKDLILNNSGTCPLRVTSISSSSPEFEVTERVVLPAGARRRRRHRIAGAVPPGELRCEGGHAQHRQQRPCGTAYSLRLGHGAGARTRLGDPRHGQLRQSLRRCLQGPAADLDQQRRMYAHGNGHRIVCERVRGAGCHDLSDPIAPGTAVAMPIRLAPSSFGAKSATITVNSDDPSGPKTVSVSGNAPPGRLVVTGSTCIGGVKECCLGERTIAICNVGRLRPSRHERRLQAQEQALEAHQQPVPGDTASRVVLERADPVQGDGEVPEGVRARHHERRSGDAGEDARRHGIHHPEHLAVAASAARIAARAAATRRTTRAAVRRRSTAAATTRVRKRSTTTSRRHRPGRGKLR